MGHIASQEDLNCIVRRFDLDGDSKINLEEFTHGMKSTLTNFDSKQRSSSRISSGGSASNLRSRPLTALLFKK